MNEDNYMQNISNFSNVACWHINYQNSESCCFTTNQPNQQFPQNLAHLALSLAVTNSYHTLYFIKHLDMELPKLFVTEIGLTKVRFCGGSLNFVGAFKPWN